MGNKTRLKIGEVAQVRIRKDLDIQDGRKAQCHPDKDQRKNADFEYKLFAVVISGQIVLQIEK